MVRGVEVATANATTAKHASWLGASDHLAILE
jgi:hypothetical protein